MDRSDTSDKVRKDRHRYGGRSPEAPRRESVTVCHLSATAPSPGKVCGPRPYYYQIGNSRKPRVKRTLVAFSRFKPKIFSADKQTHYISRAATWIRSLA